ncbi:MAG: ATP synthase F1 subunit delta [Coriobacteriia bacterium]|nr:ATP synthase F1 subunit delta [Coriobacteriia bacterium]
MPANRLVEKEKVAVYANALFDAATAAGGQDVACDVQDQVESIVAIVRGNADLDEALTSSTYSAEQRAGIAKNVFASCNPVLVDVLAVMAERGDFKLLSRVGAAYSQVVTEKLNVTVVDITTYVELDDHLRELITNKAAADFGTDVVLREHIDKTMLGGILMSANGKRLNASVRWQLDNARSSLKQTV